jgi:hypothetical protein
MLLFVGGCAAALVPGNDNAVGLVAAKHDVKLADKIEAKAEAKVADTINAKVDARSHTETTTSGRGNSIFETQAPSVLVISLCLVAVAAIYFNRRTDIDAKERRTWPWVLLWLFGGSVGVGGWVWWLIREGWLTLNL